MVSMVAALIYHKRKWGGIYCFGGGRIMAGKVIAVCVSEKKGTVKREIDRAMLAAGRGIEGDAHAGPGERQVSLLADEKIGLVRDKGLELVPGVFGENIVTSGIDFDAVPTGTTLVIGGGVKLLITVKGKECHSRCAIFYKTGDCIMPVHGVFARVLRGGVISRGDPVLIVREPV
jgi:MOSC domain-containing protein YiiM